MTQETGTPTSNEEKPRKKKKKKKLGTKKSSVKKVKGKKLGEKRRKSVVKGIRKFLEDETGVSHFSDKISDALCIPCTSHAINRIVSGGRGFPVGRIVELIGPESSGKSLLLYDLIAHCQQMGGYALLADCEDALEEEWAESRGIVFDEILPLEADTVEQLFSTVFGTAKKKGVVDRIRAKDKENPIIVGVDSIAALSTEYEMSNEYGKPDMGAKARYLSQAFRKIRGKCKKQGVLLVCINQVRDKIGVMFGDPETTPGGKALKFMSSVRLRFEKKKELKVRNRNVGIRSRVKAIKNRVWRPHQFANVNILFDDGLTKFSGLFGALKRDEVIVQPKGKKRIEWDGKFFTKKTFEIFVDENPEILKALPPTLKEDDEDYETISDSDS